MIAWSLDRLIARTSFMSSHVIGWIWMSLRIHLSSSCLPTHFLHFSFLFVRWTAIHRSVHISDYIPKANTEQLSYLVSGDPYKGFIWYFQHCQDCQEWNFFNNRFFTIQGPQAQMAKSIKLLFINYEYFCSLQNILIKHIYWHFVMYEICMKHMSS